MAPPVRTPRQAWIDAALSILSTSGPDAIRVETLAAELGVTRGGFYRQFAGRQELLDAVLDAWEHRAIDDVLRRLAEDSGDARSKVRKAGRWTLSKDLMPIDLAVREWARRDPAVGARLERVDNSRLSYLRELIGTLHEDPREVEARSLLAFSLMIADYLIAVTPETGSRAEISAAATDLILG
ncbi:TetR/AcrR family transcriptional regulator [Nocardia sp. NPDC057668]|uniref:TetR/AcrR family transcriptional regulator n=1 Tax=Nocardia sp. NPDC057668 TaxID=3346202 RepID=UPI00366C5A13